MLTTLRAFLNRPISEDFSLRHQGRLSAQAAVYVFILLYLFFGKIDPRYPRWFLMGLLAVGSGLSSLVANVVVPKLFPRYYDEDRWTVARHAGHVLVVLLFVTAGNQFIMSGLSLKTPPFILFYLTVTAVGIFPISIGIMVAEQRRLKRNLAQSERLNTQLDQLHSTVKTALPSPDATIPKGILLTGESGKDRLSLLPNQFIYAESVGNYVEVHWLNFMFPQKTVLRSTLKEVENALADHAQFFRCHRAFLVNLRAVSHSTGNARGYQLTMSGSQREIPVARSYVTDFEARMQQLTTEKAI
jgi:DNA-binding LytR/AlgR family response regulator